MPALLGRQPVPAIERAALLADHTGVALGEVFAADLLQIVEEHGADFDEMAVAVDDRVAKLFANLG